MNGFARALLVAIAVLWSARLPAANAEPALADLPRAAEQARRLVTDADYVRTPVPESAAIILEDPFGRSITLTARPGARWEERSIRRWTLRFPFGLGLEVRLAPTGTAKAEGETLVVTDPFGRQTTLRLENGGTLLVERRWSREAKLLDRSGRTVLELRLPAGGRARVDPN